MKIQIWSLICLATLLLSNGAHSETLVLGALGERKEASTSKKQNYLYEGFFVGGDKQIKTASIREIRRGADQKTFERVVFDLDQLPYFQVQAAPDEGRYIVSFWANMDHKLSEKNLTRAFQKSRNIKQVNVLPKAENDLTMIELQLRAKKQKSKVEVFQLQNPSRLILDIL